MNTLLAYLDEHAHVLTIYDYTGDDETLQELVTWLHGYGVRVQTVRTEQTNPDETGAHRTPPENVALLHHGGELLGAETVDTLLAASDFERPLETGTVQTSRSDILSALTADVAVKPALTVKEMVRISREFERRALREESGTLHAGFQQLSQIAESKRTREMYTALANTGVDVTVYGYPNVTLDDVPFTVVEDHERELENHWFLLYDGGDNPARSAALVSEERPPDERSESPAEHATRPSGCYDSYFTTDPETVETLFELASAEHGELLELY